MVLDRTINTGEVAMSTLNRRLFLAGAGSLVSTVALAQSSSSLVRPSQSFDRDRFIDNVKRALSDGPDAVDEVMARAVSDPNSVLRELGEPNAAAIELLHREDDLSIFNIVWPPMAVLVPHDHLMWATIGVYTGREDNIMWRRNGESIEATTATSVGTKEVFALPSDAVHSVVNPVSRYTAAIHVYGGDLSSARRSQWDPLTLSEKPFDVEEGRRILQELDRRAL